MTSVSLAITQVFPLPQFEGRLETSAVISPIREIEYLKSVYIFLNPQEVERFLLLNSELIDVLLEAPMYIYRIFGEVPLYLELHRDPEEGWDELFVIIKSSYSAEKALQLENKLFEEWFVHKMDATKGRLNITEEPL